MGHCSVSSRRLLDLLLQFMEGNFHVRQGKWNPVFYSRLSLSPNLQTQRKNKQLFCSTSPMLLITFTLQFFFSFSPYRRKTNGRRAPAGCLVHGALPVRCSLYPFGAGNNAAGISRRHPLLPIAQLWSTQKSRGGLFLSDWEQIGSFIQPKCLPMNYYSVM